MYSEFCLFRTDLYLIDQFKQEIKG